MQFLLNTQIIIYFHKFTRFMPPTIVIFETMAAAVASISPLSSMSVQLEKQDAFTHSIPIATAFRVRRMSGKAHQR